MTDRWLHAQLRAIEQWRHDPVGDAVAESLARALTGVDALAAAGALSTEAAADWRLAFERAAEGDVETVTGPELRERAARVLGELLAACDAEAAEFKAALHVFAAVGAVDAGAWDAKLRERLGRPSAEEERALEWALNSGATEADLLEVLAGPDAARRGYRLLLVLRFADGVSLLFDKDEAETPQIDWPEWELSDDLGTPYEPRGEGGSEHSEHVSFAPSVPAEAAWLQARLRGQAGIAFQVRLA